MFPLLLLFLLLGFVSPIPTGVKLKASSLKGQELVDYVNQKQNLFKAKLHHLTDEEEKFHVMNAQLQRRQTTPTPEITTIKDSDIPTSFDSRTAWNACSSIRFIREQANCGSCWAVSSASVISDRTCIASNGQVQIEASAADILSCCHDCGTGCNGGVPLLAMQWWHSHGVVTGGEYESAQGCKPYPFGYPAFFNETTPKCTKTCTNSGYPITYEDDKHFGEAYYEVPPTVAGIQKEIMTHGPVATCFEQYGDFNLYDSGIYVHTAGEYVGIHCVRVLGWGVDNGTPYWLAANSRGEFFGENGFFRFLRGVDECAFEAVMAAGRPRI